MTPREYLEVDKAQKEIIRAAELVIERARKEASKTRMPKNVRPATVGYIRSGQIIWHKQERKYGGNFWNVVVEPYRSGYEADDGCCYDLDGAFVEVES